MNTQTVTLDGKMLNKIAHGSRTAEIVMTDLALRERLRSFSDIQRTKNRLIRQGERVVEGEYMSFWKDLQDAGMGVIVYGRKGKPDRFEWHYSMKKVAKAALEGTNESVEKLVPEKGSKGKAQSKPILRKVERTVSAPRNERIVFIQLKNYCLEFKVPTDLNKEEIGTIENALRRLSA